MTRRLELAPCAVCGHTNASLVADEDALRREVEQLWEFHDRRLRPGIPVERLSDRVTFSEDPPYRLVACRECGLVYRNPAEVPESVTRLYARARVDASMLRVLHEAQVPLARRQARDVLRAIGRGRVLEVGSYAGAFLAAARDVGLSAEGLDINPSVNAFVREMGLAVHDGDIADFRPTAVYDAVVIWNTFDQLPRPRSALHRCAELVRPGGLLALRVVNGAAYRRIRSGGRVPAVLRRAALAHNNLLGFPYRFGFTARALERLLRDCHFEPSRVCGDVLPPIADAWTKSWARIEERGLKTLFRPLARLRPDMAPWIECHARRAP